MESDLSAAHEVVLAALFDYLPEGPPRERETPITDDQRLVEDLGYDSLAIAEIVFFLEDLFGVIIQTADLKNLQTVGDLRTYVDGKLAESLRPE